MSFLDTYSNEVVTPADLASELGVDAKKIRDFLRERYPRTTSEHGDAWDVDAVQAEAVRSNFGGRSRREAWVHFAELINRVAADSDIAAEERDYKVAHVDKVLAARAAVAARSDDAVTALKRALAINAVSPYATIEFVNACGEAPEQVFAALDELWGSDGSPAAMGRFVEELGQLPSAVQPTTALTAGAVLLFANGVEDYPPYSTSALKLVAKRLMIRWPDTRDAEQRYRLFQQVLDGLVDWAAESGSDVLPDRLAAQGALWALYHYKPEDLAGAGLVREALAWRGKSPSSVVRANRKDALVEDAAWRILYAGLTRGERVFSAGPSVWTSAAAQEITDRMLQTALESEQTFDEKVRSQFAGASSDAIELLAEFQMLRQVVTDNSRLPRARETVALLAGLAGEDWTIPAWLVEPLSSGVFSGGNTYNLDQWVHVLFLAELVVTWSALPAHAQDELLADPWEFAEFLESVPGDRPGDRHMRTVLCYVAWPNVFHPITSAETVAQIRHAYAEYLSEPGGDTSVDVQRDLFAIQEALERLHGGTVDFYRPPYDLWRGGDSYPIKPVAPAPAAFTGLGRVGHVIADSLFMDAGFIDELTEVLEERRQLVLYGPPGTGKTFIARHLAKALAGDDNADAVSLVQFHPSYSYEDFFEGFRPVVGTGGAAGFQLHHGPLKLLAERATRPENTGRPFFLVIDEMNRGNLAKVFGELYFLLEYRTQPVYPQYSPGTPFSLPENLFIIGTMNTTDRSIGLIDAAIRRRFAFKELHPDAQPVRDVLHRYVAKSGILDDRAALLAELNRRIDERDLRIGPSYLMRDAASRPGGLERVWEYDVLPLLVEHFYDRRDAEAVKSEFSLDNLRSAIEGR